MIFTLSKSKPMLIDNLKLIKLFLEHESITLTSFQKLQYAGAAERILDWVGRNFFIEDKKNFLHKFFPPRGLSLKYCVGSCPPGSAAPANGNTIVEIHIPLCLHKKFTVIGL